MVEGMGARTPITLAEIYLSLHTACNSRYYDRYIQQCSEWADDKQRAPPQTVALALREQMVEVGRIPIEPTDRKPDVLLTPDDEIRLQ